MLVQPQPRPASAQHASQRLLANLQRLPTQVHAVKLQQVEGIEEDGASLVLAAHALEQSQPLVVAGDRFPVDQAGAHPDGCCHASASFLPAAPVRLRRPSPWESAAGRRRARKKVSMALSVSSRSLVAATPYEVSLVLIV